MKKILTILIIILILGTINTSITTAENTDKQKNSSSTKNVFKGLILRGEEGSSHWYYFFSNAQNWYYNWANQIQSGILNNERITDIISNNNISLFYIIAHSGGESTRFLTKEGKYYTAEQLKTDMSNREPIKFAFICCCEGMSYTGPGSLSYEFRKGKINDTVTVGYSNFSKYKENGGSMWTALNWQDIFLYHVNRGLTIKKAFDIACWKYPELKEYVKFVGDKKLKITKLNLGLTDNSKSKKSNKLIDLKNNLLTLQKRILLKYPIFEKIINFIKNKNDLLTPSLKETMLNI